MQNKIKNLKTGDTVVSFVYIKKNNKLVPSNSLSGIYFITKIGLRAIYNLKDKNFYLRGAYSFKTKRLLLTEKKLNIFKNEKNKFLDF